MIKNERQYRITKARAEQFALTLSELAQNRGAQQIHPLLEKAQEEALQSQLDELREELQEYEALQSGKQKIVAINSFDELPKALIKGRIGLKLSQKDLAERLGLKEQQIQRYEATEYSSASLTRLKEVIGALGIKVRKDLSLDPIHISAGAFLKTLKEIGLEQNFVLSRLLPVKLEAYLRGERAVEGIENLVFQSASTIGRIFEWSPTAILRAEPLQLQTSALSGARFKMPVKADEKWANLYTVYAHYLALIVLETTKHIPRKPIPDNASSIRKAILSQYGAITFKNAVYYTWSLGIPILPLRDNAAFHGACWRVKGRNIVVLKQKTVSCSRWLFDLFHELWHAGQVPNAPDHVQIEYDDFRALKDSSEEQMASEFSGQIVLGGRAEELAELCVRESKGKVEWLKVAVPRIAAQENVPADFLANYMAFRLSLQDINWWGTANNLQDKGIDPWKITRDVLLEKMQLDSLNEGDHSLLSRALAEVDR